MDGKEQISGLIEITRWTRTCLSRASVLSCPFTFWVSPERAPLRVAAEAQLLACLHPDLTVGSGGSSVWWLDGFSILCLLMRFALFFIRNRITWRALQNADPCFLLPETLVVQESNWSLCAVDIGVLTSKFATEFEHHCLNLPRLYKKHSLNGSHCCWHYHYFCVYYY